MSSTASQQIQAFNEAVAQSTALRAQVAQAFATIRAASARTDAIASQHASILTDVQTAAAAEGATTAAIVLGQQAAALLQEQAAFKTVVGSAVTGLDGLSV